MAGPSPELKRLQAQQEANSAQIARMQMLMQAQNARRTVEQEGDDEDATPPAAQGNPPQYQNPPQYGQPPQQHQQQPQQQYQQVDPNQLVLQAITNQAANQAIRQVQQGLTANADVESKLKKRMERLVGDFPALTEEDSLLVRKSRESYARIATENPALDEATKYELAVREAASLIGARPVNAPVDIMASQDFVMPASANPARARRSAKSRLTPNIIMNAKLMGIPVDPNTKEGQAALTELSTYSERFNADVDESQFRFR